MLAYLDTCGRSNLIAASAGTAPATSASRSASLEPLADERLTAHNEVRKFFENRVAHWDDENKLAKPRFDTEVVATASFLAFNDAQTTGKLHPLTRRALDRMWTLQLKNGAWDWLKCRWPPFEHDDYYGAVLVAMSVGLLYSLGTPSARPQSMPRPWRQLFPKPLLPMTELPANHSW